MASTRFPEPFVIEPASQHELTVILVHGRGSTSKEVAVDFFSTGVEAGSPLHNRFPGVRWVFPTARHRMSTVFHEEIPEWYDVWSLVEPAERCNLQKPGLAESIHYIENIIQAERNRLEAREVQTHRRNSLVLGGISMGCAVGMHVLLHLASTGQDRNIEAFFGWCGWLPFAGTLEQHMGRVKEDKSEIRGILEDFYRGELGVSHSTSDAVPIEPELETGSLLEGPLTSIPVILSHCVDDSVIDVKLGRELRDSLRNFGVRVEWQEYGDGGHWIKAPEAIDDFAKFLGGINHTTGDH